MAVFRDLKKLLEMAVVWEERLTDFYDAVERTSRAKELCQNIVLLKKRHVENLDIVRCIDIEAYGKDEWIQNVPEIDVENLLCLSSVTEDMSMREIFARVLKFERRMKEFYGFVADKVIDIDEKELFESLVQFKDWQIIEIRRNLE